MTESAPLVKPFRQFRDLHALILPAAADILPHGLFRCLGCFGATGVCQSTRLLVIEPIGALIARFVPAQVDLSGWMAAPIVMTSRAGAVDKVLMGTPPALPQHEARYGDGQPSLVGCCAGHSRIEMQEGVLETDSTTSEVRAVLDVGMLPRCCAILEDEDRLAPVGDVVRDGLVTAPADLDAVAAVVRPGRDLGGGDSSGCGRQVAELRGQGVATGAVDPDSGFLIGHLPTIDASCQQGEMATLNALRVLRAAVR